VVYGQTAAAKLGVPIWHQSRYFRDFSSRMPGKIFTKIAMTRFDIAIFFYDLLCYRILPIDVDREIAPARRPNNDVHACWL
jgi:hypothetical protein